MGTAVVTGAGRGLGSRVGGAAYQGRSRPGRARPRRGQRAETAAALGGRGFGCDVSDRAAVFGIAAQVGPVDVLVNNAGIWKFSSILDMTEQDARRVLEVQLLGTVWCIQAFAANMPNGGSIVNTSSGAASLAIPGCGIYPAAKGGIEILTRQLAQELAPRRIRVNAVAPGGTVTEGTAAFIVDDEEHGARVPLGRVGRPADIADAVAFLASDAASYISGQILRVDGGISAGGLPSVPTGS